MNKDIQLPNGLHESLQILPDWYQNAIYVLALLPLAIVILYWMLRQISKRSPKIEPAFNNPNKQYNKKDGLKNEILTIKKIYGDTKNYREGLYALTALIKHRLEILSGEEIEEMTPTEIDHILSEKQIVQFLKKITSLQYQKKEPDESDFNDAIGDALKYVADLKKINLKKAKGQDV